MRISAFLLALPLMAGSVRVYQTNSAGDAVDVIDPATNKVVFQVKDIEVPHGVAFSPDGKRAYISCESEKTLWATDTTTGKLLGKAPLSGHPNNISISKDGRRVFVAIVQQPGAVDVIDTATMKNIKSIAVKGGVHNTYVTPDGKFVLAGSIVGKILTVIDPETLNIDWELPFDQGVRPIAFETAADGSTQRLFIQLSGYNGFAVVDFKTHEEVSRIKLPDEPGGGHAEGGAPSHGIGVTPDGKEAVGRQLSQQWRVHLFAARFEEDRLREDRRGAGLDHVHSRREANLHRQFRLEFGIGDRREDEERSRADSGGRSAEAQRDGSGPLIRLRVFDPGGDGPPFRIVFGRELASAAVENVASGIVSKRMDQQAARFGTAGDHEFRDDGEIFPRLRFGPSFGAFIERLKPECRGGIDMAGDAAGMAGTFFEENRLDFGLEGREIERLRRGEGSGERCQNCQPDHGYSIAADLRSVCAKSEPL